ncbi:MAG: regulatory protein RecX [Candidatus Bipolaricaulia bacterium]
MTNPPNDPLAKARERLIAFLSTRPRSVEEARARLQRAGFALTVIEDALDDAEERGWLDDAAFAKLWVDDRLMTNPRGPKLLRHELREKGVDEAHIERALEEADIDEPQLVRDLIERQKPRYWRDDLEARRRKLFAYLQRRGFTYRAIRDALDEADLEDTDA